MACVAFVSAAGPSRTVPVAANGRKLRRRDFEVFLHATVPANDGGISLGRPSSLMKSSAMEAEL